MATPKLLAINSNGDNAEVNPVTSSAGATSGSVVALNANSAVDPTLFPVVNASGQGFMIADGHFHYTGLSTTTGGGLVANRVNVVQFILPVAMTFGHVGINVTTASAGATANFGIYSAAKNLLIDSTAMSMTATGTVTASFTPVTLQPGVYYLAWACTSTTPVWTALLQNVTGLINAVSVKAGSSANALSAGALPSVLGTVTAGTQSVPACFWES